MNCLRLWVSGFAGSIAVVAIAFNSAESAIFDSALVHYQFTQSQAAANLFADLRGNVNLQRGSGGSGAFPTIVPGPANAGGDAIQFASSRTLTPVTVGSDSILNLPSSENSNFSLSAWVKRPANGEDFIVSSKMDASGNFRGWWVLVEDGGQITAIFRNSNVGSERLWYRTTDPVILDGDPDFHHVAVTYDFVDGGTDPDRGISIYLDGVLQPLTKDPNSLGDGFDSNDYDLSSSSPFTINGRNGAGTLGSSGAIAELAIWNTALSAQDIAGLTAVPEPASLSLLTLGALAMLRRRRG